MQEQRQVEVQRSRQRETSIPSRPQPCSLTLLSILCLTAEFPHEPLSMMEFPYRSIQRYLRGLMCGAPWFVGSKEWEGGESSRFERLGDVGVTNEGKRKGACFVGKKINSVLDMVYPSKMKTWRGEHRSQGKKGFLGGRKGQQYKCCQEVK